MKDDSTSPYGAISTEVETTTTAASAGQHLDRLDELLAQQEQGAAPLSTTDRRQALSRQRRQHRQHHRRGLSYDTKPPSFRRRSSRSFRSNQQEHHHRRRTTSLSEFLFDLGQETRSEWSTVSQTLVEEMKEYDRGFKTYNMDMALVRSVAVLPDDLMDLAHESIFLGDIEERDDDEALYPQEEALLGKPGVTKPPSLATITTEHEEELSQVSPGNVATGAVMLVVAVLAVSSNGTALHLLAHVPPPLKLYWRMTATTCLLTLFLIKAAWWNKASVVPLLTVSQWMAFGMAVVLFAAHNLLLYAALEYTTIGNAIIYANSQALLLIVGKFLVGQAVTCLEGLGVVVAFTGALLCSHDSEKSAGDDPGHSVAQARLGDFLALLSAVAGVLYLTLAKTIRSYVPVTSFIWMVMCLGSLLVLAYLAITGVPVTWDRHPYTGLFGWMVLQDHHVWILLHIAVVGNVLGTMGFVRAMAFFSTTTIAVATLMEPLLAQLIGYVFHVGLLPGPLGYVGNGLVMIGTIAVVWQSAEKADGGGGGH